MQQKLLRWHHAGLGDGEKSLQYSDNGGSTWQSYKSHPLYQPEFKVGNVKLSKGFRTAQILLGAGYTYVEAK